MIEYAEYDEAKAAIDGMNGKDILGQPVHVGFCFKK